MVRPTKSSQVLLKKVRTLSGPGDPNHDGRRVRQVAEALFALPQRIFGLLTLGYIAHDSLYTAIRKPDYAFFNWDRGSILTPYLSLEPNTRSAGDSCQALPPGFTFVRQVGVQNSQLTHLFIGITEHLAHSNVRQKESPVWID